MLSIPAGPRSIEHITYIVLGLVQCLYLQIVVPDLQKIQTTCRYAIG